MKTLPIINLSRYDQQNTLLREYARRSNEKQKGIVFITPPKQKYEQLDLISDKESKNILEKLKQYNKEFFGI